jgi:hypothetical protein
MELQNNMGKAAEGFGDRIHLRGCYEIALLGPKQEVLEYRKVDNVVVTSGRSYVLSRIQSATPQTDVINSIAVGTSTTAPATGDTLLGSEALRIAIATFVTGGLTNNPPSWQAQCTFATNQANTTLGEAGIFNASGANVQTMLSHVTFATINKTTTNTLAISYTISN